MAYKMQHATCNMQHVACNMQHATCIMQHATCDMQHATCDMRHATCNTCNMQHMQQATCDLHLRIPCSRSRVACCMLHVACCMLHAACCMLHVACYMLHVACCMLHVTCCMSDRRTMHCPCAPSTTATTAVRFAAPPPSVVPGRVFRDRAGFGVYRVSALRPHNGQRAIDLLGSRRRQRHVSLMAGLVLMRYLQLGADKPC